ncbi:family 20 glycosylhydrolase [Gulosibacter macacae]|nr:family 20 glycosylhydrolase [Gulosibacter macacae]
MLPRLRPATLAVIVVLACGLALFGVSPATASTSATLPPAPLDIATLPQPTLAAPSQSSWAPDASTRILVPADADADVVSEARRLAAQLVELGVMPVAPEVLGYSDATDATARDLRITIAPGDPTLEIGAGAVLHAPDAPGHFRLTRVMLQQLVAAGAWPEGTFTYATGSPVLAVHLDVARKYYPVETIKQLLRDMSWVGLNELEFHFSEFEGFAIESTTHPEIESATVYTQAEVRELIEFAAELYIRITPSLGMPGHLEHVLDVHPEFRLLDSGGGEVFGALDITNTAAVEFVHDLIGEYAALFEPGKWNIGADEFVDFGDSSEVATLDAWAASQFGSGATAYDAQTQFVNDIAALLGNYGYSARVWSDGMLRAAFVTLDPDIEVAYWTQRPAGSVPAATFLDQGYSLLNVNDEYLYFVLGERVGYAYPTGERILDSWHAGVFPANSTMPYEFAGDHAQVRGGMFAIWSDIPEALSADEVVAAVRTPIAAFAEKLANPDSPLIWDAFAQRLESIGPAPVLAAPAPTPLPVTPTPTPTPAPLPPGSAAPPSVVDSTTPPALVAGIIIGALALIGLVAAIGLRRSRRTTP